MSEKLNIGDKSGCLIVVGEFDESEKELKEKIKYWAEQEWNNSDNWRGFNTSFATYYNLTQSEAEIYNSKGEMPEVFIEKFRKQDRCWHTIYGDECFLFHKQNPNTRNNLKMAYINKALYKVQCSICHRTFYTDFDSISCVKWRSCIGAKCLSNTVDGSDIDYSKSLYKWNDKQLAYQSRKKTDTDKLNNIFTSLTYYGNADSLRIAYISDIHLMHHRKYYGYNDVKMIIDVINKLYGSLGEAGMLGERSGIVLFVGDISTNKELTMAFYASFMRHYDYLCYKEFKKTLFELKELKNDLKLYNSIYNMKHYIEGVAVKQTPFFDLQRFEKYKMENLASSSYLHAFNSYTETEYYKNLSLPQTKRQAIIEILILLDKYQLKLDSYKRKKELLLARINLFEEKYSKSIDIITIKDYKHSYIENVYAVLGNHEYVDFHNIDSCVSYFEKELSKYKITLLHNNSVEKERYILYGGTGFAKYNEQWNANNLLCCAGFTRSDEIRETGIFESGYIKALNTAKNNGKCFICVSHYPVSACLNNIFDKETIYFTGHNHMNEFVKCENKVLYADNQIGYKSNNIIFRIATTGYEYNPYYSLSDGLYKTTIEDYLQFYRYIGENIGKGAVLYQRCKDGKASLYVIKRNGFYSFFIVTLHGNSKGISIVNGGTTKRITGSTDIHWICENFDVVLLKYIIMLMPLRQEQEQLSKELKELGFSGRIHGCIVDIDFYNHIMVNPIDGSLTFYYSSVFGLWHEFDTFDDVIMMIAEKNVLSDYNFEHIRNLYKQRAMSENYLLAMKTNKHFFNVDEVIKQQISEIEEQEVDIKGGMYGVSRKVNALQRLFTGRVLRGFDIRLTETKQKAYRKQLYKGSILVYDGIKYIIIEDNGGDIITAQRMPTNKRTKSNKEELTKNFAILQLKKEIADDKYHRTYWEKKIVSERFLI